MDTRKEYVKPIVESEEILEQTSLICSITATGSTVPRVGEECGVWKNNAFAPNTGCTEAGNWQPLWLDWGSPCLITAS